MEGQVKRAIKWDGTHRGVASVLQTGNDVGSSPGSSAAKIFPMARRIILHIGAPKTATSAIQRFLASNIEPLRASGIDYLNGELDRGNVYWTGNGTAIFLHFTRAETDPGKLESLISSHFGSEPTAIISCELLSAIPAERWNDVVNACRAVHAEPSVIYYVRNVHPYYISTYNQAVKHNTTTDTFEEFVTRNSVFTCRNLLEFLVDLIGADRVSVAHYESQCANICAHFLTLVCPGADPSRFAFDHSIVNRSLDEAELRLMLIANRFPGAHFPGELSNLLMSIDPNRATQRPVHPDILALLTRRHADDVSAINAQYFGGQQTLSIADAIAESAVDASLATAPAEKLFEWAIARLASARKENFQEFLGEARARAARSRKPVHPDLPSDFDPAAYLLANPDLLLAQIDPYRHFLDHGRWEGRSWRIDGSREREHATRQTWVGRAIGWVSGSPRPQKT
jgi:hypothetical protein